MDIKEIKKIIPHRYPMLLIDKVESIEPLKKAVGYKNVTFNESFFQGHFEEEPVMPGVLIIEALAQLGAVAILCHEKFKGKIAYFTGINNAKFRKKVIPGDTLKLEIEIVKLRGKMGIGKAIATVEGKKAVEAELSFIVG